METKINFKKLLCCIVAFHFLAGHVQSQERQVVAPSGADYAKTSFSLSLTVGELSVETIGNAHHILTPGFQQPPENSAALPLQWLSFTAVLSGSQTRLQWVTAQESGNDYFEIQRSADGLGFAGFLTVKSRGDNVSVQNYSALDPSPVGGKTYYRIRQVDKDGHYSYSSIIAVNVNLEPVGWRIVQNPVAASAIIEIRLAAPQQLQLQLFDIRGGLVMVGEFALQRGTNTISWDMHALAGGLYLMSCSNKAFAVIKLLKK